MPDYRPQPIDTTTVQLSSELIQLTETLAENAHENWAAGRLREGWKFGPKRDDTSKEHPCLVPYSELSDSEKWFDRASSMETLKAIVKLGYKIASPAQPSK